MGFRSTFTTEQLLIKFPSWFIEKYESTINFDNFVISPKSECKTYGVWRDLDVDLQEVIIENNIDKIVLVYLHECEGITKVIIKKDSITYLNPTEYKIVDGITHNYCYGCEDKLIKDKLDEQTIQS